jgi:DNA-binding protein H-NS
MPRGMPGTNMNGMSVEALTKLRDEIDEVLASKVSEERHHLEDQLKKLDGLSGGARRGQGGRSTKGQGVAPKYRNPDNPAETWAGRGLKPRWLTAAMKGGKKLEDFAIAGKGAAKQMPVKKRGRPRRK